MPPLAALVLMARLTPEVPPPIDLTWRAPAPCPDGVAVAGMVGALLREPTEARADPLVARATVTREGPGWLLRLELRARHGSHRRTARADDCQVLARAAALLIAIHLDPLAVSRRLELPGAAPTPAPPESPPLAPGAIPSPPAPSARPGDPSARSAPSADLSPRTGPPLAGGASIDLSPRTGPLAGAASADRSPRTAPAPAADDLSPRTGPLAGAASADLSPRTAHASAGDLSPRTGPLAGAAADLSPRTAPASAGVPAAPAVDLSPGTSPSPAPARGAPPRPDDLSERPDPLAAVVDLSEETATPPPPRRRALAGHLRLEGGLDYGVLPRVGGQAGLFGGVSLARLRVEAGLLGAPLRAVSADAGAAPARFDRLAAVARVCPLWPVGRALVVALCLAGEAGAIRGVARVAEPQVTWAPWLGLALGPAVRVRLAGPLALHLGLEGVLALARPTFTVGAGGDEVFRATRAGARASLGLELQFARRNR